MKMQSALIESILIGIPLPPIFAFSNENFEWEIIDGLQRTTTLINFLNSYDVEIGEAPKFEGCEILTELNGKTLKELPSNVNNAIRNARIRLELVEDTADSYSQYLLFSRLNNNSESLSSQELRNFLIYKLNPAFFNEINNLRNHKSFIDVLSLSKKRIAKQEDLEYVIRFFLCRNIMLKESKEKKYSNIDSLITTEIEAVLSKKSNAELENEYELFKETFDLYHSIFGDNGYRYYHKNINTVVNTSIVGPALSTYLAEYKVLPEEQIKEIVESFFLSDGYQSITAQSYSPPKRFFKLSIYAHSFFEKKILNTLGDTVDE